MPRFTTIQQRFTQGELDPAMLARDDIDQYYGAAATMKNVFSVPQGGFKRRPGLEHIDRLLGGSLTKLSSASIDEDAPNGGGTAAGLIGAGVGSIIGDMTDVIASPGGEALAFDGTTNNNNNNSAQKASSTFCYIGKDYSSAPKKITQGKVYASNNSGFTSTGSGTVSATMYGKNGSAPANDTDGTSIGTGSVTEAASATITITSTDQATSWDYVWIRLSFGSSTGWYVTECEFTGAASAGELTDQDPSTTLTTTTNISTTDPYVVAHYDLGSAQDIGVIYLSAALITAGTSDEFFIQVSTDDATWVSVGDACELTTTAKDFSRRVHGSYQYVRFARIGSTDLGTAKITLGGMDVATESGVSTNKRCIDFEFNVDQTYKMVATDKNLAIYQGTTYLIDVYIEDMTDARLPAIDWEYDADTLLIFHGAFMTKKLTRGSDNDIWTLVDAEYENIPAHAYGGSTITEPAFGLTVTGSSSMPVNGEANIASSAQFDSSYVGQYINTNDKYGRFYITEFVDSSNLKAKIIISPDDPNYTPGSGDWEYESGYEPVWSASRGYPRRGKFYQGRLYVDGGEGFPSALYGSVVNDFFNFDFGAFLDDKGIGPLTGGFDPIEAIYPGRSLMVFTSNAEYIVPQTFGEPITPENATLARQSSIGSEENFRPQEVEGGVLYIQREGGSVQEFIYDDAQNAFSNAFVSLLASHLVSNPQDFALRKASSVEDGSYILMPKADGNLTIANILRSQGITSFFEAETDGNFEACGVDVSDMYFVVQRTIDGETIDFLERFNDDHLTDASVRYTSGLPTDTFTGLDHIEGETASVIIDGAVEADETVSSGSITADSTAYTSAEVGLNFTPTVVTLPASVQLGTEVSMMGRKMNQSEISLRLKDCNDIVVNGKALTLSDFTGVKRLLGWRGWVEDAQVTITQTDPLPMTVLAIKQRINT